MYVFTCIHMCLCSQVVLASIILMGGCSIDYYFVVLILGDSKEHSVILAEPCNGSQGLSGQLEVTVS